MVMKTKRKSPKTNSPYKTRDKRPKSELYRIAANAAGVKTHSITERTDSETAEKLIQNYYDTWGDDDGYLEKEIDNFFNTIYGWKLNDKELNELIDGVLKQVEINEWLAQYKKNYEESTEERDKKTLKELVKESEGFKSDISKLKKKEEEFQSILNQIHRSIDYFKEKKQETLEKMIKQTKIIKNYKGSDEENLKNKKVALRKRQLEVIQKLKKLLEYYKNRNVNQNKELILSTRPLECMLNEDTVGMVTEYSRFNSKGGKLTRRRKKRKLVYKKPNH
jgi:ribosomal protein S15P/S13E